MPAFEKEVSGETDPEIRKYSTAEVLSVRGKRRALLEHQERTNWQWGAKEVTSELSFEGT